MTEKAADSRISAHTPGPWVAEPGDDEWLIFGGPRHVVAYMPDGPGWDDERTGTQRADATLIAAAPGLLATLEWIRKHIGVLAIWQEELTDVLDIVIAKATDDGTRTSLADVKKDFWIMSGERVIDGSGPGHGAFCAICLDPSRCSICLAGPVDKRFHFCPWCGRRFMGVGAE